MLINHDLPQASIYYISYLILKKVGKCNTYVDLFLNLKREYDINFRLFDLSLDLLFMMNKIRVEKNGVIICL